MPCPAVPCGVRAWAIAGVRADGWMDLHRRGREAEQRRETGRGEARQEAEARNVSIEKRGLFVCMFAPVVSLLVLWPLHSSTRSRRRERITEAYCGLLSLSTSYAQSDKKQRGPPEASPHFFKASDTHLTLPIIGLIGFALQGQKIIETVRLFTLICRPQFWLWGPFDDCRKTSRANHDGRTHALRPLLQALTLPVPCTP